MRLPGPKLLALLIPALMPLASAIAASPLADLIQAGRRDAAVRMIEDGADLNASQADGSVALHWAVYRKDAELVERLLAGGADASVMNRFGSTPLAEAVKIADPGLVRRLLDAGADPESPNLDGQTALMLAARSGSTEIARMLVAAGADVNAREEFRGQTALMWAADGAYAELTRFLVDAGADVTARAVTNDWGSQITSEPRAQYRPTGGLTVLLYAARSGCSDCISTIVAAGESIDRPTPDGVTPLMLAIDNLRFTAAAHLLDLGANPHYADWWGRTALYIAVDMNTEARDVRLPEFGPGDVRPMDIIARLLDAGVEVNPQLNMHRVGRGGNSQRFTDDMLTVGATPLLRAAIKHDDAAIRLLLQHGAIVDLPNVMGVTPLMAAAGVGVRATDFGTNRFPDFESPGIEEEVIASLRILLDAGADINAKVTDTGSRTARIARPSSVTDALGQTALFRVASRGWLRVTEFMLANGADAAVVDALGRTARDAALGRLASGAPVYQEVADLLAAAGG